MKESEVIAPLRNCVLAMDEALGLELYEQADYDIKRFERRADLLKVATECRADILKTISEKKPQSLYELAKLIRKNQAYIYRETKVLQRLGLVEFVKTEDKGRKRVRPETRYAQIVIHL